MRTIDDYLEEQLKNPEFRAEYEGLDTEYVIVNAIITTKIKTGLTSKELAKISGISRREIERIEFADANPSLRTLKRLAAGMGMKLKLEFSPISQG